MLDSCGRDVGEFVLYWMRTAIRADENPALDVARKVACELDLPLLVYQGLSSRYEFASDRHHTFILEGARDVQADLGELGVSYVFYLETQNSNDAPLRELAGRAQVVVTEDMPTAPAHKFLKALRVSRRTTTASGEATTQPSANLIAVDTACVVPMQLVGKAYTRAFQFRSKTQKLYDARVTRGWPMCDAQCRPFTQDDLKSMGVEGPWIDLQKSSISELVSQCSIDHSVGPVADTIGGTVAGYRRWEKFRRDGLRGYAKNRNDAVRDGVSRMSAYLHYGMVSPLRLAREAGEIRNGGATKYLDELLIWRELAHNFCFYREDHSRWTALPDWAQETLEQHATDHRRSTYSWEELARGSTESRLWNAAQHSLLMHGELHNNLRMTWGKAILDWVESPRVALKTILDLNHRYALDGRDPSSYGGILWCLGQFDRPFSPEQQIVGSVRPRPIDQHENRMDVDAYSRKIHRLRLGTTPRIAVVGAGLSGAIAARTLRDHGHCVTVFEKSRGAGGRMSTRRSELGDLDHGAQYFTARDPRFRRYVDSWIKQGIVEPWAAEIQVYEADGSVRTSSSTERFVAVPAMNSLAKSLVVEGGVQAGVHVGSVESRDDGYLLLDREGDELGVFDQVVIAIPAPQAAEVLRDFDAMHRELSAMQIAPCWAALIVLPKPLVVEWGGAFVNRGIVRWAARNATKPGRLSKTETLVLHADAAWTRENLERDPEWAASEMLSDFWQQTGLEAQEPLSAAGHRWRYSIPENPSTLGFLGTADGSLVACGDWACGARVEGAFLSGMAAAGRILGHLHENQRQPQEQLLF